MNMIKLNREEEQDHKWILKLETKFKWRLKLWLNKNIIPKKNNQKHSYKNTPD